MKYHLITDNNPVNKYGEKRSACGLILTPDKAGFEVEGFNSHYNKPLACRVCIRIAKTLSK